MQAEFPQEALRLNRDEQCYKGEKFVGASYSHYHLCWEVDTKSLHCSQLQAIEIQKEQNLFKFRFIAPS